MTQHKQSVTKLILEASPSSLFVRLALPSMLGLFLMGLNRYIDAVFVGQYLGEDAVAGLALAFPPILAILSVVNLVGTGAAALLSIAIGAQNTRIQQRILGNLVILSIALGGLLTFSAPFSEAIIQVMGGEGESLRQGTRYLSITLWASIPAVLGQSLNHFIRGEGKMVFSASLVASAIATNIALTALFVAGLGWGIEGAAWATNISMLTYCAVSWFYFKGGFASFDVRLKLCWDNDIAQSIVKMGFPMMIVAAMNVLQHFVIVHLLTKTGTARDVAFFGVVHRTVFLAVFPIFGLMRALQPVIGINYGANQMERGLRTFKFFNWTGTAMILAFWIPSMLWPKAVLNIVLSGSFSPAEVFYFRLYTTVILLYPFLFNTLALLLGIAKASPATMLSLARQLILFLPIAFLLTAWYPVSGIYYTLAGIDFIVAGLAALIVRRTLRNLEPATQDGHQVTQLQTFDFE